MSRPTVGLALIAKNEERNLPTLLRSIEGCFDRVVLADTGSKDKTVELFTRWCEVEAERHEGFTYEVGHFDWCQDFAAARRYADSLLDTDWNAWADADDELVGAQNLRGLAAQAAPDVAAYIAAYDYAHDAHGNVVCVLKRERLVRRGLGRWEGMVHEAQALHGAAVEVGPDICRWVHRKQGGDSNKRNLKILREWVKREPENPRVLAYLGTENAVRGRHKQAVPYYRRYLKLKTGWDQERAQVHRKLAVSLMALGQAQAARQCAYEAMTLLPEWPDSYLTLAQVSYVLGDFQAAECWARRVLELGHPETLLIVNPTDYTLAPRLILAGACGALHRIEEAIEHSQWVLGVVPDHPEVLRGLAEWRSESKRQATVKSVLAHAELLVQHDEQLKALRYLEECVPHYVWDDPHVVACRSQLRERVQPLLDPQGQADHYEEATELGIPEEHMHIVPQLPRAVFLLDGLREQMEAAA